MTISTKAKQASPNNTESLFRPFRIHSLELPNRIVMAPMGRLFAPDNVLDEAYCDDYRRRAEGGTGLVISEATGINQIAVSHKTSPCFFGEASLAAWRDAVNTVHSAGARFMPRLWHAGLARDPKNTTTPHLESMGPSGWCLPDTDSKLRRQPGRQVGSPMTQVQIDDVVSAYGDTAVAALKIGCDGIEVHGAHGYLIDQFLWADTNHRTDSYGGDTARRTRFTVEVVSEVRRRASKDFPISFRFSQWKIQDYEARIATDPQQLEQILAPLADAGGDLFHCSTRRFWQPELEGSDLNLAGWAKKLISLPTVAVGSVGLDSAFGIGSDDGASYSENLASSSDSAELLDISRPAKLDRLIEMMERGDFDLVAVGRASIANPDWADLVRTGQYQKLQSYYRQQLMTLN